MAGFICESRVWSIAVEHSLAAEQQLFRLGHGGLAVSDPKAMWQGWKLRAFQDFSLHKYHQGFGGGRGCPVQGLVDVPAHRGGHGAQTEPW